MKVVVDIKDNKLGFFAEMMKNLNLVKKIKVGKYEISKAKILQDL